MAHHEITHSLTLRTEDLVRMLQAEGLLKPNMGAWIAHAEGKSGGEITRFAAPDDFQFVICWRETAEEKNDG